MTDPRALDSVVARLRSFGTEDSIRVSVPRADLDAALDALDAARKELAKADRRLMVGAQRAYATEILARKAAEAKRDELQAELHAARKEADEAGRLIAMLKKTEMTELRRAKAERVRLAEAADKLYTAHAPAEPGHPLWDALRDALDFAEGKS
jgi:hypothetical protein